MENMSEAIIKIRHDKLRILWIAILSGMTILTIMVFIFYQGGLITEPLTENPVQVNRIMLIMVFVIAALVILLRRNSFVPDKLIKTASKKMNMEVAEADENQKDNLVTTVFARIQTLHIIIWMMSEAIVFIGFINYLFIISFQASIMYCIVGIYSMLISYPRRALFESCYYRIKE